MSPCSNCISGVREGSASRKRSVMGTLTQAGDDGLPASVSENSVRGSPNLRTFSQAYATVAPARSGSSVTPGAGGFSPLT